ncbi:MAG: M1 family aminopeptidase [Bacteroidota bacterium]
MKKILITFLLLFTILNCFSQKIPNKDFTTSISLQEAKSHEKLFKLGDSKFGGNYNLFYHRMNWFINPAVNYIKGSVTSYFKAVSALKKIQFELADDLNVDSIKYHNVKLLTFTHAANIISITLPTSIPNNQIDSITIFYQGVPPTGIGFGSFIQDYHSGTPIIWTLSEPFGAPDWWPCKNSLSDKIDSIDVFVTTPSANRVGSNGLLLSETTVGANKIYHWKHKYPIATYLIAIAVTNYQAYSDYVTLNSGTLEILNYVFPENLTTAQSQTPDLIPVMQLYDSLFSDYPYMNEKYGHAQFNWGGGMEHQTMTFLVDFNYDLMAHELAHQWFGDKVTCKSWHDIWINESFATYLTGLTYKFLNNASSWLTWKQNEIGNIISQTDGSVYCDDTTSVSRIFDGRLSYDKGAMVLNMLKLKIGDSAFFSCMRNFITDAQLAYNFAGTSDFQDHAEASAGKDLTEFFNDWIYNQGYPSYSLNCTAFDDSTINLIVSQQQSHASVSFFKLPLPIRFSNGTKDTLVVFDNTIDNQSFYAHFNFIPNTITFDPESELVAQLISSNIIYSVNEIGNNLFKVGPNPCVSSLFVENISNDTKNIEIYNIRGQLVRKIELNNNLEKLTIDITDFENGVYILKFINSNNNLFQKIVKI